jgi:hypothetical protein
MNDDCDWTDYLFISGIVIASFIIFVCGIQIIMAIGSHINAGKGVYSGILVETRSHGLIFKTSGAHFKTGENSSEFEDFCVTDKKVMQRLERLSPETRVQVMYKRLFTTPSWKCDVDDSSDIITDFKVIN